MVSSRMDLNSSCTSSFSILYTKYIILIGVSSGCTIQVLNKLLESTFNAMVLSVGLDKIKTQRNTERLKRDLRVCYPLVDRLIESLDYGVATNKYSSDIISMTEAILCSENLALQIALEAYTECVDSEYSCILIHGKIAVATESWWSLDADEIKLLSYLATVDNMSSSKDVPVFLPYRCPNVAYRFVACMLIPHVQVCCLCGPTPLIKDIEQSASQCFKSSLEVIEMALRCHPRNLPNSIQLESGVLGILLINTKVGKYVVSRSPSASSSKHTSNVSHRLDLLRTFYYRAVLNLINSELGESKPNKVETNTNSDKIKKPDKLNKQVIKKDIATVCKETYWCSEYYKCHALISDSNILCVLYTASIPTHTARLITAESLKILTTDKQLCW